MECASTRPEGFYIVSGLQEVSQNTPFQACPLRCCWLWLKLWQCAALLNILWMEMALYKFQLLLLLLLNVLTVSLSEGGSMDLVVALQYSLAADQALISPLLTSPLPVKQKYNKYVNDTLSNKKLFFYFFSLIFCTPWTLWCFLILLDWIVLKYNLFELPYFLHKIYIDAIQWHIVHQMG